jgi:hypothetical protein
VLKLTRYLFFLRSHNDTDNIAPAIWFLLEDDPVARADIVYYNFDFPYLDHPYITALTLRFGDRLKIAWIGAFLGLSYDHLAGRAQVSRSQARQICKTIGLEQGHYERLFKVKGKSKRRHGYAARLLHHALPQTFSLADLQAIVTPITSSDPRVPQEVREAFISWIIGGELAPSVAVFDHQRGTTLLGFIAALRKAGIDKIIRLPVSPMMNINVLREIKERFVRLDRSTLESELDFSGFDAIAFTDPHYPTSIRNFFRAMGWHDPLPSRLEVLGSIRYCPEWLAVRPPAPVFVPEGGNGRIKLAFFLSRHRTNTYWEEVERTVRVVDSFPAFRIIIQPHPRAGEVLNVEGTRAEICTTATASSLVAWADVVMLWGSSVGLEALAAEKTLLCLNYLNANRNVYELMDAGWILKCRDDLALALATLERDPQARPYRQADVNRLNRELVLAGGGRPVPARYLDFIRGHEKPKPISQ